MAKKERTMASFKDNLLASLESDSVEQIGNMGKEWYDVEQRPPASTEPCTVRLYGLPFNQ